MHHFAMIGVAGFIAPRHLKAIKETGNNLVAALDKFDQVGVLDSFFPQVDFFTEFERFDRHIDLLKRKGLNLEYISVCTPNYLHDSHIRFGLRHHANVICEKPLVLNPWNVDSLKGIETETGRKVYTILQLRLHQSIIALREKVKSSPPDKIFDIDLTYITSRGSWYHYSWKGDETKSGGIATNIGIHFFDMLAWVFGPLKNSKVFAREKDFASGYLEFERARVRWFLSINYDHIPDAVKSTGKRTFRSITMNDEEIEFSEGFTDLHTISYKEIIKGNGFGLDDAAPSIQLVHDIRNASVENISDLSHPFFK